MANYDYRIGPLEWDASEEGSCWRAPVGAVGMVDLGRESDFDSPGSDRSMCVFAVPAGTKISNDTWPLLATGDMREIAVTSLMQDAWESQTGYRPSGDKLVDLIFDHLTSGSDPDWGDACKPLMPTVRGNLDLHFGGHSLVKRERFRFGVHPHTNRVKALLHRQFAELAEAAGKGRLKDKDHHRRVLDYWCEKYKLTSKDDWKELVPAKLQKDVPGRLKHETAYTDDFNRAGSDSLGANWTEVSGDWDIVSNVCSLQSADSGQHKARYEADLSGEDHYAECEVIVLNQDGNNSQQAGACARFSAAANTSYTASLQQESTQFVRLFKTLTGTRTNLGDQSLTFSLPDTVRCEIDGSTLRSYFNGAQQQEITDTSITGNLRCGLHGRINTALTPGDVQVDNFEAADLAPGGGAAAVTHARRRGAVLGRELGRIAG